ncbi:hypothetical protein A3G67_00095 [Candidatus Roizmanbacteria bacterium RIFCSPLOWO2_12_FULL_40_12]|uniref:Major facilitator superfamily (MFS) profile domain-containing protein n=1 Tax=Candidatus Roizmanbacteria bacterium RIFCSPLOWO2_01_FULL_40_42 TaxID=1802066 RepID=A0A1F7J2H0_9BACT|nr:MAG: hypothetical protein A2779_02265 [Candidatus Roizmanbacteria bacterium RIFCSPHIGHO2_01_FULL_40_98]OGK28606.1 MAG: hypothetical protein A3C31_03180 [Candidatus Roizmanbacteria bacterium RIFCSPHIGHO2_02_FULL_40_53]OGK29882.1 MAG: hypothetical protein A2W49_04315 [Candidatus Roizmanbacteria bacterium RIFCSPHIGHO2_12_41_18]OGK36754.1 MAG: hypothetical protein A3E69_03385 [Candidatus Roizmanbacteria bacterium RIFCSPHIGHO2_12_FULL_40_130]OGK49801.1 MAG: hypothetical protein A3B50_03150 [Candi
MKNTIWRYYAFTFLISLHFFAAVLVPFYLQYGGLSKTQMFLIQSWFLIWIFILEIPTGVIADYLGRKTSLVLGAFIVTLAVIIYGAGIPGFGTFLLAEFLFAVSIALTSGADDAFLYDSLKETGREKESKKIFGRSHAFQLFGFLVAAPIGGVIASTYGLNYPIMFSAVPFFLATLIALTLKEPKYHRGPSESRRYWDIAKKGLKFFLQHKTLRLIALDAIIVSASAYYVIWLYQPLLLSLNVPVAYFGWFHALFLAVEILVSISFARLEKLFKSSKNYLSFCALITSASFLLVALFQNVPTIMFFLIFAGGFGLSRIELMIVYMNKLIRSSERATILSSVSMFRRFTIALLNPIVGILSDKSLTLALLFVGILPLLVFFFSPVEKSMLED